MTTAEHPGLDLHDDEGGGDGRADERGAGRGPVVLGVLGAVMVAFSGVVWSAYHQGVREGGRSAAPVIRAVEGPFKVTPQERGGATTPHLDKEVYSRFDGEPAEAAADRGRAAPGLEGAAALRRATAPLDVAPAEHASERSRDAPPDEAELATEAVADAAAAPGSGGGSETGLETALERDATRTDAPLGTPEAPGGGDRAVLDDAPNAVALDLSRGTAGVLTTEPRASTPASQWAPSDPRAAAARDRDAGPPPRPAPTRPITSTAPPPVDGGGGRFAAQLGSYRSERAAELAWEVLYGEAPGLFGGRGHDVVDVDLGERGVFFRLYVPGFAERDRAAAYCERVLERGYGCIVAGR